MRAGPILAVVANVALWLPAGAVSPPGIDASLHEGQAPTFGTVLADVSATRPDSTALLIPSYVPSLADLVQGPEGIVDEIADEGDAIVAAAEERYAAMPGSQLPDLAPRPLSVLISDQLNGVSAGIADQDQVGTDSLLANLYAFEGPTPDTIPDPSIAAGPEDIVAVVNSRISVYDKNGVRRSNVTFENFFAGVSAPGVDRWIDPWVIYDSLPGPRSGRFVVAVTGRSNDPDAEASVVGLAVSDDPVGIGPWFVYVIPAASVAGFMDQPRVAASRDLISISGLVTGHDGADDYLFLKSDMYNGGSLQLSRFAQVPDYAGGLSLRTRGVHSQSASDGNHFILGFASSDLRGSLNRATYTCSSSCSSVVRSGNSRVDVLDWESITPFVAQRPGTSTTSFVDPGFVTIEGATRSGGEIIATMTTESFFEPDLAAVRILRFNTGAAFASTIEIHGTGSTGVFESGLALSTNGEVDGLVGYNVSNTDIYPSVSVRTIADGVLTDNELVRLGDGPRIDNRGVGVGRWGDYAGAGFDPVRNSVWTMNMYGSAAGTNGIGVWIEETGL